jgi:hypothetical protein
VKWNLFMMTHPKSAYHQKMCGFATCKVYLEMDPFQKHPSADLTIIDPQGKPVSNVSIIESMVRKMELTMHLRGKPLSGKHTLEAVLFYGNLIEPGELSQEPGSIERRVVDNSSLEFELP